MLQSEAARRPTEVAREAARLARKVLGHEVEVIWFGSWPLGRAQAHSDIDLAMAAAGPIPLERMAVLREVVDNFPTLYEIDLVDLASVGQSLRTEILLESLRRAIDKFRAAIRQVALLQRVTDAKVRRTD